MQLPRMVKVRQKFTPKGIGDLNRHVSQEVERLLSNRVMRPGNRIAIAVGSRGINHLPEIIATVVAEVKKAGGEPFIVPAMGSHGGGTAEGQAAVLRSLGIIEERVGASIVSSLDVVQIGETEDGLPVWLDKNAAAANGIILVNRIKVHTDFHGPIESGLVKMLCIGLGKHQQAVFVHCHGIDGLRELIPKMARVILARAPVLGGIAVLEDAYDETAKVVALAQTDMEAREKELLVEAKALMPSLPFEDLDVLIVDRLGKNISGTGMDTNIIGRIIIPGEPEPESPRIKRIVLLDLSEETHGNALGMGLADFTTRRMVKKIDYQTTYTNVITSGFLERGKIPLIMANDREAIEAAVKTSKLLMPDQTEIIRITNTLKLDEIQVSETLLPQVRAHPRLEILSDPEPIKFDRRGNLLPMVFPHNIT